MVIAGGRSLRFGGEKAVAPFAGLPMLLWAVRRLARVAGSVAVNARPGTGAAALAQAQGLVVLHDLLGDPDGPMAGVRAGLVWAGSLGMKSLAVSPCDVPLLPEDLFVRLALLLAVGGPLWPAAPVFGQTTPPPPPVAGPLVIIGGGLAQSNEPVFAPCSAIA